VKVSIVIVVYNNRSTVAQAIESVLSQRDADIELIVVDGASTDGTREVLAQYASYISVLVSEPDQGIYDALNKGIGLATGDIVGFLHSDDLLADDAAITRVIDCMQDSRVDAVYGDLVYVRQGDTERVVRTWRAGGFIPSSLARGWMPPHPTFYARREIYKRFGSFDTTFRIAADYDCMLRFLKAGIRVVYIPHLQVRMRVGGISNRSFASIVAKSVEDFRALRNNNIGAAVALICKNVRKVPQFFLRSAR
jgi:glycosyltransferase involved in cell wall biosynthesis